MNTILPCFTSALLVLASLALGSCARAASATCDSFRFTASTKGDEMDRGLADRTALYMNEAVRLAGRSDRGTRCDVEIEGAMKSLQGAPGLAVRYIVRHGAIVEPPRLATTEFYSTVPLWNALTEQIDKQFAGKQLTVLQGWTNEQLKGYLCNYASSPKEITKFKSVLRQSLAGGKYLFSTEIDGIAETTPPSVFAYDPGTKRLGVFISEHYKLLNQLTRYNYPPERRSYSEKVLLEIREQGLTGPGFFVQTNPEQQNLRTDGLFAGPQSAEQMARFGYVRMVLFDETIFPYEPTPFRRFITFNHWTLIDASGKVLAEARTARGNARQAPGSRFSDDILCAGYEAFIRFDEEAK